MSPSSEKRFAELCQTGHPWSLQRPNVQLHLLTSKDFGKMLFSLAGLGGFLFVCFVCCLLFWIVVVVGVFLQKTEYESVSFTGIVTGLHSRSGTLPAAELRFLNPC